MAEDDLRIRFGQRCRALRRKRGLSQMDMVKRFDWTLSHYQKIERGSLDVRLSTAAKLAECFSLSLAQLMRGL